MALWLIASIIAIHTTRQGLAEEAQRTVFPLSPYDEPITVPVMIAGKERLFVLDSGSSVNVYHTSLRESLENSRGHRKVRTFFGNKIGVEEFRALPSRIGNKTLSTEDSVACLNLSAMRAATGRDIEGILGMPWFGTNVVQLDFDSRKMVVYSETAQPTVEWGQVIAVRLASSGIPEIEVESGNAKEWCVLDTGSTGSIALRSKVFKALSDRKLISSKRDTAVATAGGILSSHKGTLSDFKVAEFFHSELPVIDGGEGSRVGLEYLRRFRVTLDLGNRKVYLVPGAEYNRKVHDFTVGIGLVRPERKTLVLQVIRESPGDRAGILVNDELLAIDGEPVTEKPLGEIRSMLKAKLVAGGELTLTVRRKAQDHAIQVRL